MKKSHCEVPQQLTLRRGLKAMFHHQDVDAVIDSLCLEDKSLFKDDIKDQLKVLLRIEHDNYTIDQNESFAVKFCAECPSNGLFDALASYVSSCCDYLDGRVICKKECLLRWHETSTLISEDLMVCAYLASNNFRPFNYAWTPFLATDRDCVNNLLSRNLADVHAHLVGSSFNFDVNWICLMNHIEGQENLFNDIEKNLQNRTTSLHYCCNRRSYYTLSIFASAIRLILFGKLIDVKPESEERLKETLSSFSVLDTTKLLACVSTDVRSFLEDAYVFRDSETGNSFQYDYAHCESLNIPDNEACAFSVFSGERYIMYSILNRLYNNKLPEYDASLFYIYLLIKHKIRHELIQTNDESGFRNFQLYDKRKVLFINGNPQYMGLLKHLSVASMFAENSDMRFLETRMVPQKKVEKQVMETDMQVLDTKLKRNKAKWDYGYVFHFIKQPDSTKEELFDLEVRHAELRKRLKQQACSIIKAHKQEDENIINGVLEKHRILGIDAASSEIATRPEVFAQTFRYCRRCVPGIGITYHVGEDFHDLVDGLRSIDECIRFLGMNSHDRLGHALALGTDAMQYYNKRKNVIVMPNQVALDNIMWLYIQLKKSYSKRKLMVKLEEQFNDLFNNVYGDSYKDSIDIETYYKSWLLRGDDPYQYQFESVCETDDDVDADWYAARFLMQKESIEARSNLNALKLFFLYHHDKKVKLDGTKMTVIEYPQDLIKAIKRVQKRMLDKVETLKLCIECNPTSNYRIGGIDRYDNHPISKFYSNGLNGCMFGRKISSSINTDDKGVFATSIEREYELIAEALIRDLGGTKKAEKSVTKWLDNIRECSLKQKFDKIVVP